MDITPYECKFTFGNMNFIQKNTIAELLSLQLAELPQKVVKQHNIVSNNY